MRSAGNIKELGNTRRALNAWRLDNNLNRHGINLDGLNGAHGYALDKVRSTVTEPRR